MRHQVLGRRHDLRRRPALSSAPSSVVPDAVTMSWPIVRGERADTRRRGARPTDRRAARDRGRRSARCTIGRTSCARHLRRRVDVRDEADHRHVQLGRRRRNRRHDVAVLVHRRVVEAEGPQLVDEQAQQHQLARRAGKGVDAFVRARVDHHVAKEAFESGCAHAGDSSGRCRDHGRTDAPSRSCHAARRSGVSARRRRDERSSRSALRTGLR